MMIVLLMALAQAALQPGAQDIVFEKSPPHSDADELKARFRSRENAGPYDVSKEKFRLLLPKSYAPGARWGLFIYISADDSPGLPGEYAEVLEKHRLIALAPYRAGNGRNIFDRFRLAIDACFNGQRRFDIDPDRVIISGFSGGARVASMLGVAYADLFPGGAAALWGELLQGHPLGAGQVLAARIHPGGRGAQDRQGEGALCADDGREGFQSEEHAGGF